MNKKSLLMMMVTICLIAVVGVGATLAYLSDSTGPVTNTFTFVKDGIKITLDEAPIGDDNRKTDGDRVTSNNYKDIIPGMVMDKDPTVTVLADSVNCYVVVGIYNPNGEDVLKINGSVNEDGTVNAFDSGVWANPTYWTYVKTDENNNNIKYYKYNTMVESPATDKALNAVFETVTFNNEYKPKKDAEGNLEEFEISNIVIKAAAVQADNNTENAAVEEAIGMLKFE